MTVADGLSVEPEEAAVQVLLSMSDILAATRQQRYHALWMFADKLLPTITRGRAKQTGSSGSDMIFQNELPLPLFAVACLMLALQSDLDEKASKDSKQVLKTVYATACSALGASFGTSHSSTRLLEAAAIVRCEVKTARQKMTSDYLLEMHRKIQEAGLASFQDVALDTCFSILELLYASADYRRSHPLECGGKLLAAAIIASTFALRVQPAQVSSLPFLSWLSDLSKHPKDVIKAQTEQVVACLLQ
ncbi:hypothetical protein ABBQ32_000788 [Trebouxia sp. C0010 RCD-2024]